ncbi:hypothetical protein AWB80_03118 [Caballeronia pedi]|uniref:Uncharacterized protein n=1 Tax=Caballeronia pedi TaxID=1777141 RepID=A0A158B789_9BURK|nr:DUF4224 domain-containing protein [Caballeronia pedi]SAK65923.1 hypothetical protein AWB80_03118 [Caballeronia pedi]
MAIVTNDQLVELTGGLRQGAAQKRWIKKALGIDAPRKADGHPLLTWEQVNRGPSETQKKSVIKWKNAA